MKTILVLNNTKDSRDNYYRCPECNTMFRPIIVFKGWDYYDCLPKYCPYCCKQFDNGLEEID